MKLVIRMSIGERIANLRKAKQMTQQQLGEALYVNDKTISSWEKNRTEPNLDMVIQLSEILECSASFLIYGEITKNDVETEIKIRLTEEEFKNLERKLKKEARFTKESRQIDTYYQPTYRKFVKEGDITEWLRIGERGNKKIVNYKNWYDNMYCDEFEVEIDNSANLDKIFNVLGLKKLALVDKVRKNYVFQNKYEFSLDVVKGLGCFVEIEVKKYDAEILEEYDNLLKLAKSFGLNLDHIDKKGYPFYFIEKE